MGSEEKGEERRSTSSNTHAMAKARHRRGATHKRSRVLKLLVGYHNLGALNALDISRVLSGAVVTARTKEILQSKMVQAYKGSSTGEPKDSRRHRIHLPLICLP
jgi:hypothetical protein